MHELVLECSGPTHPLDAFHVVTYTPRMSSDRTLEIRTGEAGPELVRRAHDDLGRERLAREIRRLTDSSHPGVVTLLRHDEDQLVLDWAGGDTLETIRPETAGIAAIVAQIAATIADLHRAGIVHGRVEASHVVIGSDGRPRLAGMRGADADAPSPTPADDVHAIGRLLDRLVSSDGELEPIPERRFRRRRWSGYERRALQLLADRATDPDPARRPTAVELAAAITEAIPGAAFEPTDDRTDAATPTPSARITSPSDALSAGAEPASSEPEESQRDLDVDIATPSRAWDRIRSDLGAADPIRARDAMPAPPTNHATTSTGTSAGGDGSRVRDRSDLLLDEDDGPAATQGWALDGEEPAPSADESAMTEPARPLPDRPGRMWRIAPISALGVAAGLLLSIGALRITSAGSDDISSDDGPPMTTAESIPDEGGEASACELDSGPDIDGDGCPDPVRVDGNEVIAAGRRYLVGEEGDRVRVDDWDCGGVATVALVRPSTGEVFTFPSWEIEGESVTVGAVTVVADAVDLVAPEIEADPDADCRAAVRRRDGSTVAVTLGAER